MVRARFALLLAPLFSLAAETHSATLKYQLAEEDSRFQEAFAVITKWIHEGAFPGATLAVGQKGAVIAFKAFGRTQYSPDAPPVTTGQIFDLASLTKVVGTTTAIAILYEENKLALDAPVSRYLPEFAAAPQHDRITIRHLLTHSSGLQAPGLLYENAANRAGILKQVYTLQLDSAPGDKFAYRDPNFVLLGEVVERVSGKPLDEFLHARIFGPLARPSQFRQGLARAEAPGPLPARLRF